MPDLELDIELTDGRDVYHPGDAIAGEVKVVPGGEIDCSELRVTRRWQTDGVGDRDTGAESVEVLLDEGEIWYGAGHYAYEFETDIPQAGPYTYSGEHVDVDWVLEAVADVPWASDPNTTVTIPVEPSGDEETYSPGIGELAVTKQTLLVSHDPSPGCGIVFGLLLSAPAIFLLLVVGAPPDWSDREAFKDFWKTMAWGVGGLWALAVSIREGLAQSTFENVDFTVDTETATPGDSVECRLVVPGRLQSYCRDIDLELVRIEEAEDTSGKRDSTWRHVHTVDSRTPEKFDPDAPARRHTYTETFRVPEDADFSVCTDHNQVNWGIRAAIDAPWWPDWSTTEPLFVQPSLES